MEAFRRAGVKPEFERLPHGVDPAAYIWSSPVFT